MDHLNGRDGQFIMSFAFTKILRLTDREVWEINNYIVRAIIEGFADNLIAFFKSNRRKIFISNSKDILRLMSILLTNNL